VKNGIPVVRTNASGQNENCCSSIAPADGESYRMLRSPFFIDGRSFRKMSTEQIINPAPQW
jgi:hypothetical protein